MVSRASIPHLSLKIPSNFFLFSPPADLAPQKKTSKFEAAVMTSMDDLSSKLEGFESVMKQMLDKLTGLEAWRATADASMDKLLATAGRLHQSAQAPSAPPPPQPLYPASPATAPPQPPQRWTSPFDLNLAPQQEMRPSASTWERPHGHRVDLIHREGGYGSVTTFIHPPIKGAYDLPPKPRFSDSTGTHTDSVVKLPKIPFPLFEGDNPRLWLSRCELYFDMYSVPTKMWIKVASMYFKGAVGRWWQSIQKRLSSASWSEFSSQFNNCLGREQHELSLNMWSSFLNRLTN